MTLTKGDIINILANDKEYVRHVHSLPADANIGIFEIPRSSFTALRLTYASPVELSLSSKVVLLGGIPEHWYEAQGDFRRRVLKMKDPMIEGNVKKLNKYGLKTFYNSENFEEELLQGRPSITKKSDAVKSDVPDAEKPIPGKIKHSSTALDDVRRLKKDKDTRNISFLHHAVNFYQKPLSSRRGKLKRSSKTSGDIPTVSSLTHRKFEQILRQVNEGNESNESYSPVGNLNENKGQSDALSGKSPGRLRRHPPLTTSPEDNVHDSPRDPEHLQQLYRKQEQNEIEMNKLLNGIVPSPSRNNRSTDTYASAAAESENAREPGEYRYESVERVLSKPFGLTDPDDDTIHHHDSRFTLSDSRFNENGPNRKNSRIGRDPQATEKHPVVFVKPFSYSKAYKRLSILQPKPENMLLDQRGEPIESDSNLISKIHSHKMQSLNNKRKLTVTRLKQGFSRRYDYNSFHVRRDRLGPIVMMDKMLVIVKNAISHRNPVVDFSEAEPIDTRVTCRLREFLVIARLTHRNGRPILIQLCHQKHFQYFWTNDQYKNSSIPGNTLDFYLNQDCIVGLYNALDNSIFIEKPDDKLSSYTSAKLYGPKRSDLSTLKFYIFKCRTLSSTSEWYHFLQSVTGTSTISNKISLRVPAADVFFTMTFDEVLLERFDEIEKHEQKFMKIACLPRGYCILQIPIFRYLSVIAHQELRDAGYNDVIRRWEGANINLGINFRHYDMIRWCPGHQGTSVRSLSALFPSNVLELRPYAYYGRKLNQSNGPTLIEPAAVEGFLLKLTGHEGNDKTIAGKPYVKPSYFFTSENLLFTMASAKSTPPVPLNLLISLTNHSDREKVKAMMRDLPDVYEQNPYPLDLAGHIEWLKEHYDEDSFAINDYYAYKCFSRGIIQILKSESLIDMTDVEEIRQGSMMDMQPHEITFQVYNQARSMFWKEAKSLVETAQSLIFIKTNNGCEMKLLAPSSIVSKEWVMRLKALVRYWKGKKESDFSKLWGTKVRNINNLKITEEDDANINGRSRQWMTERGFTDPSLYNINGLAILRPIVHRGVLFQKPKKHSVFLKYWVVLIPGFLILYRYFRRSKTGYAKPSTDRVHYMTIPIEGCYVYSGTLTELDLLDRNKTFDELNPGSHSLPRIYSDGWSSSETETSRCFTLWFGKKRILSKSFKNLQQQLNRDDSAHFSDLKEEPASGISQNPNMIRMVRQLGVSGKSMVFMARSRQERDIWVLSLHYELERAIRNR